MKDLVKKILSKSGYRVTSTKYRLKQLDQPSDILALNFDHILCNYLMHQKPDNQPFSFIQVGAFDGVLKDPIFKYLQKYDWRGVMLEPQPLPFSKLKAVYKDRGNISVRNAALSDNNGKTVLYTIKGNELPEWAKGMASFNKENILKHQYMFPDIADHIEETEVETVTFDKLFSEFSLNTLDLLQTDTEGYDAEIIKMFPFNRLKPRIIHFESKHILKPELEALLDMLITHGYKVAPDGAEDMMAILEENQPR